MKLCLSIEIQEGLSYDDTLAMTRAAEDAGFDAALLAEHYYPSSGNLERISCDAGEYLGGLARETTRIMLDRLVPRLAVEGGHAPERYVVPVLGEAD